MFIGHYALALGSKRLAPGVSLGALFLAAQWADLLWPTLVLAGVESFTIRPGATAVTPLDFQYYPYSHSLLALLVWGTVLGLIYRVVRGSTLRGAVVLGALVVSHWVLDLIVHRPDLPLVPGIGPRLGLGLWDSLPATLAVEFGLYAAGVWLYWKTTAARDRAGAIGFWALVAFLAIVELANLLGPPPPSTGAVTASAQAMWLLVAWGYWVDRHRRVGEASQAKTGGSWKRWVSLRAYGLVTSTLFPATASPLRMRARFERFGRVSRGKLQRRFPRLRFQDHAIDGLAMESVCATDIPSRVILYLHGGAYLMGSPASYRDRAMRLSYRCDAEVFVPAYRLAPEHPYPAALDDALAAWRFVRSLRPQAPLLVAGDSAGGGLSLSLLVRLRDLRLGMPSGAVLLSPWTDLTVSGASVEGNRGKDLWFTRRHLETWARYYVGGADARSPYISPVFADLAGLPPLMLLAGEDELLLDDARRVGDAARDKGTSATVLIGEGMQHDWPLTLPWLAESRRAWNGIRTFIEQQARAR